MIYLPILVPSAILFGIVAYYRRQILRQKEIEARLLAECARNADRQAVRR